MSKYFDFDDEDEFDVTSGQYELFGVIACDGEDLKTSRYMSLVNKKLKKQRESVWYEFQDDQSKQVTEQSVLTHYNPQILFYQNIFAKEHYQKQLSLKKA